MTLKLLAKVAEAELESDNSRVPITSRATRPVPIRLFPESSDEESLLLESTPVIKQKQAKAEARYNKYTAVLKKKEQAKQQASSPDQLENVFLQEEDDEEPSAEMAPPPVEAVGEVVGDAPLPELEAPLPEPEAPLPEPDAPPPVERAVEEKEKFLLEAVPRANTRVQPSQKVKNKGIQPALQQQRQQGGEDQGGVNREVGRPEKPLVLPEGNWNIIFTKR